MALNRKRLLLATASLGLALAAAEWAAQRWYPVRGLIYALDTERIHVTVPDARRLQILPDWADQKRVMIELNSLGLRGPELRQAERRLLVVGDSLVLAGNVPREETFVLQMEERLQASGTDWEVLNAGAESYGPDQSLLQLDELLPLQPDAVVLVLCAYNDFGDLHRNKLFGLSESGELLRQEFELGPRLRTMFEQRSRQAEKPALWSAWTDWRRRRGVEVGPQAGDYVQDYLLAARYQYQDAVTQRSPLVDDIERDTWDADVALHADWPSAQHKRRLMTAVLRAFAARCAEAQVPLLVLVVPSAVDLDPDFWIQVDRGRYPNYEPAALSRAMADCAREAGLSTVDLFERFAASQPDSLFVGGDDMHWNARAQALGAEECLAPLASLLGD